MCGGQYDREWIKNWVGKLDNDLADYLRMLKVEWVNWKNRCKRKMTHLELKMFVETKWKWLTINRYDKDTLLKQSRENSTNRKKEWNSMQAKNTQQISSIVYQLKIIFYLNGHNEWASDVLVCHWWWHDLKCLRTRANKQWI